MLNYISRNMSNSKLQVTLLADEWKSSKGGLSTINRELAIQLAKLPNVSVTFFVPKCTEDDKNASSSCNVRIVKARELHAFDPLDWLSFPPDDLSIDIIIGHGVKLGKQAQIIRESHRCKWVQVVHTAPEELSMLKTYSDCDNAISKGDKKQWNEIKLCQIADLVVAVGPRLWEFYSRYLSSSGKRVFNLTPGIFSELSSLKLSTVKGKRFNVLLFGRGDSEDFKLKGFDIAAKAVAQLNDTSYKLVFVGAPSGNEEQVAEKLLEYGLSKKQLVVKSFLESRGDLATLLSTADLAIIPSRSEGFGLTALEALSAGLPFLVTQASGFGEALQDALPQSTPWVVDSEESEKWAEAIKSVREKGREAAIAGCQTLRESYGKKYIWESQCRDLVEKMVSLANASGSKMESSLTAAPLKRLNEASQLKNESELASNARSLLPEHQSMTEQRLEDKSGGRREGFTAHDFETISGRRSSYFCSQGTTPEKNLTSGLEASRSKMESSVTAAPSPSLNEASIVYRPEEQCSKTHLEVKNVQLKDELELSSSAIGPLPEDQRLTEQRLEDTSGGRREGFTTHDSEKTSGRKSSYLNSQGTTPEKNLSSGLDRPEGDKVLTVIAVSRLAQRKVASQFDDDYLDGLGKHAAEVCKEEDYVLPQAINILQEMAECDDSGAKQKEEMETVYGHSLDAMDTDMTQSKYGTMMVVGRNQADLALFRNWFADEFPENQLFISGCLRELKCILRSQLINSIKSCFIFFDGEAFLEEFASHKDLLLYARDIVEKKVVTVICSGNRLIREDTITDEITKILGEKVCIIWWRETFSPPEQFSRRSAPFHLSQFLPEGSPKGSADRRTLPKHFKESTLVLKTRLRHGRISYDEAERSGEWTPVKGIEDSLFNTWQSAPNVELMIYEQRENGKTQFRVVVKDDRFSNNFAAIRSICLPFRKARSPPPLD